MKIENNNRNYLTFSAKNATTAKTIEVAREVIKNIECKQCLDKALTNPKLQDKVNANKLDDAKKILDDSHFYENINQGKPFDEIIAIDPPGYLKTFAAGLKKLIPFVEKRIVKKEATEDVINAGNIAKELVCMIVYPLQVLTNPDLTKEKRRFVGMYDFFVTCFSLAGALWAAFKGKKVLLKRAEKMMQKYNDVSKYPKVKSAIEGGAFVLNIAIMTIFFKRILAPALSPPLAASARSLMEERDAKKLNKDSGNKIPVEAMASVNLDAVPKTSKDEKSNGHA